MRIDWGREYLKLGKWEEEEEDGPERIGYKCGKLKQLKWERNGGKYGRLYQKQLHFNVTPKGIKNQD